MPSTIHLDYSLKIVQEPDLLTCFDCVYLFLFLSIFMKLLNIWNLYVKMQNSRIEI